MRQIHDSSVSVVDFARAFEIEDDFYSSRSRSRMLDFNGFADGLRNPNERKDSQRRGGAATKAKRNAS
jgi:deferrochelatase/peroxidase EfeB